MSVWYRGDILLFSDRDICIFNFSVYQALKHDAADIARGDRLGGLCNKYDNVETTASMRTVHY